MNYLCKFGLSKLLVMLLTTLAFVSCSKDDEPGSGFKNEVNDSKVIIKADGSTSTSAVFSKISGTRFYLDYIEYEIVDSHIEIVGYDPVELRGDIRPYATVVYDGAEYKTRIIRRGGFFDCKNITSVVLPNTLQEIESFVFEGCEELKIVYLPESLNSVDGEAFYECANLEEIRVDKKNPYFLSDAGVLYTKDMATIICCPAGKLEYEIPAGVEKIGTYSFACSSLKHLKLPEGIRVISERAFLNSSLVFVYLPSTLETIYRFAFWTNNGDMLHIWANNPSIKFPDFSYGWDNYFSLPSELLVPAADFDKYTDHHSQWSGLFYNRIYPSSEKEYDDIIHDLFD